MPASTSTPPLRYVSHRRLTSPLASATTDATRSTPGLEGETESVSMHGTPLQTRSRLRYHSTNNNNALSSSGAATEMVSVEVSSSVVKPSAAAAAAGHYSSASQRPPAPREAPPAGSLAGSHVVAAAAGSAGSASVSHGVPSAATGSHSPTAVEGAAGRPSAPPTPGPPASVEDLHFTIQALRHENSILRQRIDVLTSTASTEAADGAAADVSPAVLWRRVARLEAALRLEALERDVVEQRLLAQERVLRAVCFPVHAPTPTTNAD